MKKYCFFASVLALMSAVSASAQTPFYDITPGSSLHYAEYDPEGTAHNLYDYDIETVQHDGNGNFEIFVTTTVTFAPGTELETASKVPTITRILDWGTIIADIDTTFVGKELGSPDAYFPAYPPDAEVGQELPVGKTDIYIGKRHVVNEVTSFKVTGRETLSTPAGDFDCLIFETESTNNVLVIKQKGKFKQWYCKGVGLVRQEVYNNRGRMTSYRVLEAVKGL